MAFAMKSRQLVGPIAALLLCLSACKKQEEPAPVEPESALPPAPLKLDAPPKAESAKPAAVPSGSGSEGLQIKWQVPEGWRSEKPKSAVRKATYGVPRVKGDKEDAEVSVFYFGPGQGGSIDANAVRWIGQFSGVKDGDTKRSDREANGVRQHLVEVVKGTYGSGMPGDTGTKENFGMVAAIVEAPSGTYFFKMIGPSETVQAGRSGLVALLDSIKPAI